MDHLEHVIAAKAVAFGEALTKEYKEYMKQVKKNAEVMSNAFIEKGYNVISDGTDNHLMLIDLRNKFPDITGEKLRILWFWLISQLIKTWFLLIVVHRSKLQV